MATIEMHLTAISGVAAQTHALEGVLALRFVQAGNCAAMYLFVCSELSVQR